MTTLSIIGKGYFVVSSFQLVVFNFWDTVQFHVLFFKSKGSEKYFFGTTPMNLKSASFFGGNPQKQLFLAVLILIKFAGGD
jgi:hypothetical protein